MRSVVISSGHGKYVRGASGYVDEVDEARKVVDRMAEYLRSAGVQVKTFHDNTSHDQSTNLSTIVNYHNSQKRDLDVSIHFNAYETTSKPMGCEVLYVSQSSLADDTSDALASAGGFIDRGPKKRTDLYFLNNTSEPAILVETCFCDSKADVDLYHRNFDPICAALAECVGGVSISSEPPPVGPPERPEDPTDVPIENRPLLSRGDYGTDVEDLQSLLPRFGGEIDGDFGSITEDSVRDYQRSRGLEVDGVVGEQTWGALYDNKPPLPPPPPPPGAFTKSQQTHIKRIASDSEIADYNWNDRGVAPAGYTQGMALAFAQSYRKLKVKHPAVVEMAQKRKNSDKDALNVYKSEFESYHMSNESDGADTLRHLYALMLGSGMRESNGRYCEGRDMSATNVQSDTAEAGLFQTSYNAHSASDPEFSDLMDEFSEDENEALCYLSTFELGVSCTSDEWDCYGSGEGYRFQELCKSCPAFAVETHALTLRNLCNHYGPIIRKEVELMPEANEMFMLVQRYVDEIEEVA